MFYLYSWLCLGKIRSCWVAKFSLYWWYLNVVISSIFLYFFHAFSYYSVQIFLSYLDENFAENGSVLVFGERGIENLVSNECFFFPTHCLLVVMTNIIFNSSAFKEYEWCNKTILGQWTSILKRSCLWWLPHLCPDK